MTELKIDRLTLPVDAEPVAWQTQTDFDNNKWKFGLFCSGDDLFCEGFDAISKKTRDCSWKVLHWQPLTQKDSEFWDNPSWEFWDDPQEIILELVQNAYEIGLQE